MNKDYSVAALRKFLEFAAQRGLMPRETANARKTSVEKVLGVLDPSETTDLRSVDLESAFRRFTTLQGSGYKPQSLRVYESRTKSAVSEFIQWADSPSTYKPTKGRAKTVARSSKASTQRRIEPDADNAAPYLQRPSSASLTLPSAGMLVVPIPIRSDLCVTISGLPSDLTSDEAEKIANVIHAFGAIRSK